MTQQQTQPTPFGTKETRLVIVRGNSGSGKTSLAAELREQYGRGIALVGQDNLRRVVLKERDTPDGANIGLINLTVRYALDHGFHAVLEGILYAAHYGPMVEALVRDHRGHTHPYYFDIPFEETLRRHATKPQVDEYGEKELRDWYRLQDFLPSRVESVVPASSSLAETANLVMLESGLAADSARRDAGVLLDEYDSGTWEPADVERAFAEDLARGRLSGSQLRAGLREAPPGRLTDLITRATPVFERTRTDDTTEKLRLALRPLLDKLASLP
ncbi:hypothetical protein ACMATS_06185 [Streptoverticillium reticulum]|uniref:hypothetical protein n=1 Tax=Streptoverticillium reticulum TaxID=1433415 RepID=UPI0039BF9A8A